MRHALIVCVVLLGSVRAEARDLHWRELAVRAELQNDGTLRVSERQAMVFNGDWNGGERIFRVERHQTLTVHGMTRIDADGTAHDLVSGDLSTVDHYFLDGNVLRWRSRAPDAPEFANTEIVYTIDYSLEKVLVPSTVPGSNEYALQHDFAFASREGNIEKFSLDLGLASEWSSPAGRTIRRHASQLIPGESYVLPARVRRHHRADGHALRDRTQQAGEAGHPPRRLDDSSFHVWLARMAEPAGRNR